jgi:L-fuconolactonase
MRRRSFLVAGGCSLASPLIRAAAAEAAPLTDAIDAHTHFYRSPWPDTMPAKQREAAFARPCLPADLIPVARAAGITGTVVVESSPDLDDNQWLLDLAAREPFIRGVVGRIDPAAADFEKHLERFAANRLFRGLRVTHGEIEAGLAAGGNLARRCQSLADRGLALDVLGGPGVIAAAARLAAEVPRLVIVIDHAGNLRIDGQAPPRDWREAMATAAKRPNVRCKVSALVENTAAKPAPREVEHYRPVLDAVWESFGEDRLLFGSNWPIWTRSNSLAGVVGVVGDYWAAKGAAAAGKFFRDNASATYGLAPR